MTFQQKLDFIIEKNNSLLCIGLDPVMDILPKHLQDDTYPFFSFNKAIIDATHDFVCAYKPNSAFYEAVDDIGIHQLKMTCDYLREAYPHIPVILDAKRGDTDNTNEGYVRHAFSYLQVDAVTLNPYLGEKSLEPFLNKSDKGIFVLCKTSNTGSEEFQNLNVEGEPLYEYVAKRVTNVWNTHNNCFLVVGATYPEELAAVRAITQDMTLLIPGIGAQGGSIQDVLLAGLNSQKKGLIISSSRSIIFAGKSDDFAQKAADEAKRVRDEINQYR